MQPARRPSGWGVGMFVRLPIANRRYSRVQLCGFAALCNPWSMLLLQSALRVLGQPSCPTAPSCAVTQCLSKSQALQCNEGPELGTRKSEPKTEAPLRSCLMLTKLSIIASSLSTLGTEVLAPNERNERNERKSAGRALFSLLNQVLPKRGEDANRASFSVSSVCSGSQYLHYL